MEILLVTPEGLRPVKQFTINGRVQVSRNDLISIAEEGFQYSVERLLSSCYNIQIVFYSDR